MAFSNITCALRKLRQRLEWFAFLLIMMVVRALPLDRASQLSGFLWRVLAPLDRPHDRRAKANVAAAYPEKSEQEVNAIVAGMWENLGRVMAEALMIDRLSKRDERFSYDIETVKELSLPGAGSAVIASLHFGNWELAILGARQFDLTPLAIYQELTNPFSERLFRRQRQAIYPGGLYSKNAITALHIVRHLKKGGSVALLADLRERQGLKLPFFGRPAYANLGPAKIARLAGAKLYTARVIRKGGVHFHIEVKLIPQQNTDNVKADIEAMTRQLHLQFEEWIREYPEQWMWVHRKWTEDGERPQRSNNHADRPADLDIGEEQVEGDQSGLKSR